jgi:hypothetical protein
MQVNARRRVARIVECNLPGFEGRSRARQCTEDLTGTRADKPDTRHRMSAYRFSKLTAEDEEDAVKNNAPLKLSPTRPACLGDAVQTEFATFTLLSSLPLYTVQSSRHVV